MNILDLCSGLGGASEAFVQAGDEVLRIENNMLLMGVPHTEMMTVEQLRDFLLNARSLGHQFPDIDMIWASPPCLEFSNGYSSPSSKARRNNEEYSPDLSILKTCIEIIEILQPRYFIIENVSGAIKHFEPLLGGFRQRIGSFFLWGNYPMFSMPPNWTHSKVDGDTWSSDPLRANLRGLIPFEVSSSLRGAIMSQRSILEPWA